MQPVTRRYKQIGNLCIPIINAIKLEIRNVLFQIKAWDFKSVLHKRKLLNII